MEPSEPTRPKAPGGADLDQVREVATTMQRAMETVIEGKPRVVEMTLTVLLAEGHLLLEDVPGTGKTMLAKTLARTLGCPMARIQFTPDLLPSDITGVSVFRPETQEFAFRRGAVFANVVVGDEINRASPKTQSALLECMEERQVSVDGTTYDLPRPFMIMATQNPIEMEGTYPLPEAQRDRFMARISMGYPEGAAEVAMLEEHGSRSPLDSLEPVTSPQVLSRLIRTVRGIHASRPLMEYVVALVTDTRNNTALRLGASPRSSLMLLRAARAAAALEGRDHVLPEDVRRLFVPIMGHRVILSGEAQLGRRSTREVLDETLRRVPVPAGARTAGR